MAFNGGSIASQNIQTLLILRFFSGTSSASALTNTGGVISDIFPANRRGLAMGLYAAGPFMGPVFGYADLLLLFTKKKKKKGVKLF